MRRLARWLLTALTLLSLLLSLAAAALWFRTTTSPMWYGAARIDERVLKRSTELRAEAGRGCLWLYRERYDATVRQTHRTALTQGTYVRDVPPMLVFADPTYDMDADPRTLPHRWPFLTSADAGDLLLLVIPCWLVAAAFALLPAARAFGTLRRRHRLRRGLCPGCSYDLTGNVSGTCPECGTKVATPAGIICR